MKTNHIFRQVLPVMLFSTLLLATTNTSAQNHWKKEKREHERKNHPLDTRRNYCHTPPGGDRRIIRRRTRADMIKQVLYTR